MADPIVTDVFKFVAVRPVQLKPETPASDSFIQDVRASTSDGQQQLKQLASALSTRESATQQYDNSDVTQIERLASSYNVVLQSAAEDPSLTVADLLQSVADSLPPDSKIEETQKKIFDSLYAAFASGPAAGPRIDSSTAALRLLNWSKLAKSGSITTRDQSQQVLTARPLISQSVAISHAAKDRKPPKAREAESKRDLDPGVKGLVDDFLVTNQLLHSARTAAVSTRPQVQWKTIDEENSTELSTILTNTPRLGDVIEGVPLEQGEALTRAGVTGNTALPTAIGRLQQQSTRLVNALQEHRNEPMFLNYVKGLSLEPGMSDIIGTIPELNYPLQPDDTPDVDVTGMIKPLGIGDLKVVKQKLLAYEAGEVAHIENVLKGESKQRVHRALDRLETTLFSLEETSEETARDTQSTDRFELKKEAEKTIKEDMSVEAGVVVTGGFGPVTVTAHGDFAYSTSQTDSSRNSSNFARDVVDRSVSKVQKRTKTERTTKTFKETEETNTHGVDNVDGPGHVTGVYRWVDKRYRAQVYNYGRRLMFEFVVPEPAAFFRAARKGVAKAINAIPPEPFLDLNRKPLTAQSITESTYQIFASRYNAAGATPPPPEWTSLSTGIEQNSIADGQTFSKSVKEIVAPAGYRMIYYVAQVAAVWKNYPHFCVQIGDHRAYLLKNTTALRGAEWEIGWTPDPGEWDNPNASIPVTAMGYDVNAYAVNVTVNFSRTQEAFENWQLQTFEKIYTAYKALKTEYDQKVTQAEVQGGIAIEGGNPLFNLEIIKRELKKLCLTMLTGKHWNDFDAMTDPPNAPKVLPEIDVYEALAEGPIVQFFEQAFDWEQITYLFYPYFWGRKSKWVELSNLRDPDPLFMHFLQSGAARVVVPVSPAYNQAILYFLQVDSADIKDKIWLGGEPPVIDDPLYKSIAEEIRAQTDDLAGAVPEGEPWEFTVPTTLVWLQPGPELPTFS